MSESQNPFQSPATEIYSSESQIRPSRPNLLTMLFSFQGRMPRRHYWLINLSMGLLLFGILFVPVLLLSSAPPPPNSQAAPTTGSTADSVALIIGIVIAIPYVWINLATRIKRWHDRDKSGYWIWINLIPYIGGIWEFIEVGCLRGTDGPNRYGPDPT